MTKREIEQMRRDMERLCRVYCPKKYGHTRASHEACRRGGGCDAIKVIAARARKEATA